MKVLFVSQELPPETGWGGIGTYVSMISRALAEKDIDVHVENGVLTLRGERKREEEVKTESYHRSERYYGTFARTFALPTTVDVGKIRASYKDGVLEVVLPKAETAKPKRIEIKAT